MKKFVFTLLLVFVCHLGYAQGINGLFNEFGSEKNADCVKVSSFMMSLGKMFAGHDEDAEIIRKIKSIKVLDLESCTASVKERFNKKVNKLNLKGYDELMRVNDEGEKVRVLMKTKKRQRTSSDVPLTSLSSVSLPLSCVQYITQEKPRQAIFCNSVKFSWRARQARRRGSWRRARVCRCAL